MGLMSLILQRIIHEWGNTVLHKQWHTLPQGFWTRTILWNIRKAEQKQGMIGSEVGHFLIRLADPLF